MASKTPTVMSELREITECCICSETFNDARVLPCIHTFCLKCLQETGSQTYKKPGDAMPCPLCRREFTIPGNGWTDLQKNFFIDRLIEVTKIRKVDEKGDFLCDICKAGREDTATDQIPSATMYCIQCRDHLCGSCSRDHVKQKLSRNHQVFPIESVGLLKEEAPVDTKLISNCQQHPTKQLELFCFDCKTLICAVCLIKTHQRHKCSEIDEVVDELKKQISDDIDRVTEYSTQSFQRNDQLENEKIQFLHKVQNVEKEIVRRNEELKQIVDKQTKSLLEELAGIKQKTLKEMENEKEELDRHLVIMDSFKMFCNQLKSKGSAGDICRTLNDLHFRADELKRLHQVKMTLVLPSFEVNFEKTQLSEEAPYIINNIVGKIREQPLKVISMPTTHDAAQPPAECFEDTGYGGGRSHVEETSGDAEASSQSDGSRDTDTSVKFIGNFEGRLVLGITKLQNKIYVMVGSPHSIQVYNDQNPIVLQTEINISNGPITDPWEIASSEKEGCLYVTDRGNNCAWKMIMTTTNNRVNKWLGRIADPWMISVCSDGNVLISRNSRPCSLEVYAPDASLIRRTLLPYDYSNLRHAVMALNGSFIVLNQYTSGPSCKWRVSKVNRVGHIESCFNPNDQSQQLNKHQYLALDSQDRVFVADYWNHRVILLDSDLQLNRVQLNREKDGIDFPSKLCYDAETKEMLVYFKERNRLALYGRT